jgi:hypothetical protein
LCKAALDCAISVTGRLAVINNTFAIAAQDLAHFVIMFFAGAPRPPSVKMLGVA